MEYDLVVGLEVHVQLKTKTKLFSTASTQFGQSPNHNVAPLCIGLPGTLPVLNKHAVELAVRAGLALNCKIKNTSVFSRKNYFYPDLPKGYQISQFDLPICEDGYLDINVDGDIKRIEIERIHIEEDAGKLLHQGSDSIAGATGSLVDLNRAGVPLIEIVSRPNFTSAKQARIYMETLKMIVEHIGVCDGNLSEGSLRCDANVSIKPKGSTTLGTRAEVKNLNSFKSLETAINVEKIRQEEVLNSGQKVVQETRNFDDLKQITTSLRSKEEAHDYRYFPEPDLPPLVITNEYIDAIKANLPQLPSQKLTEYQEKYQLTDFDCKVLLSNIVIDNYFRVALSKARNAAPKEICKWIIGDLNAFLKENDQDFETSVVDPGTLVELVEKIHDGQLSGKMAKEFLEEMVKTSASLDELIKASGGTQISDQNELQDIVNSILKENPDVVKKVQAGKTRSADFLMGQVMKQTKGKAKPDLVRQLILDTIG